MDVQMPEMNGLDATRHIISEWGNQRPWIAALTAGAMKENRDECLAAGVDDFLTKPMNVLELQATLESCFKTRKIALRQRRAALEPERVST
jgi:CheY-like chemotaxis protein